MSIATEITRLQTAKADMKTALEAKGVTVGTAHLDTYDTLIAGIPTGTDISDADAAVTDVVAAKTFYAVSGGRKTGTMTDRGTVSTDITTKAQEVTIASGKHSGSGVVKISATEQAKVIAGNIKLGVTLLGVDGTVNASGGTYSKVTHILTTSGTWTKPAGLTHLEVVCIGGGGGGASGSKQAAGVVSRGGSSPGAASMTWGSFLASELGTTETYTVGTGGTGGVSVTANSTNGNSGTTGGGSFFGGTDFASSKVYAEGGLLATNAANGATRQITGSKPNSGLAGGAGIASSATGAAVAGPSNENTSSAFNILRGGGVGGGVTTANAAVAGSNGPRYYNKSNILNGALGGAINSDAEDGINYHMNRLPFNLGTGHYNNISVGYGTPGGGGGSSVSGNAGRGGDGGNYGGAGGGGGASRNDVGNSGRGGNGDAGVVILIEHIVA